VKLKELEKATSAVEKETNKARLDASVELKATARLEANYLS
jgi:hypothetical protein